MSLLAIERLSVRYGALTALSDVSLTVGPGEIVALVGRSGSGKSTLAGAIPRLLPPETAIEGAIRVEGRDVATLDDRALRAMRGGRVAMVFQEPSLALNPALTIGRQIGEVLVRHTALDRRAIDGEVTALLTRVGLDVPADRYPHRLSGGQRQRACLAMAIAASPALLIADEPTAALDPVARAGIAALLRDLARERGMGLLLVSHDLILVAAIADRVAVLEAGRLVEEGPATILRAPSSSALQGMVSALTPPPIRIPSVGETILGARDLTRRFRPGRPALDKASFTLAAGETLAVVGESGSGKSTLARLVLGLDRLDAGTAAIDGRSWPELRGAGLRATRRSVQAVFQDPAASLDPRWMVGRIVAEPLYLLDAAPSAVERDALVAQALAEVGLPADAAARRPHAFSGGQRQRIAIARALILRPRLLVLDEALSALDMETRAEIVALLLRLQAEHGLAYLFIAHDMALVRGLADRMLVLRQGKVVEEGAAGAVLDAPRDPHTAALVAASPTLDEALAARF